MGFFTDTSVCIGCKSCEVACKEWNGVPDDGFNLLGMSFDNTGGLTANTWRHVALIEQPSRPAMALVAATTTQDAGTHPGVQPARAPPARAPPPAAPALPGIPPVGL